MTEFSHADLFAAAMIDCTFEDIEASGGPCAICGTHAYQPHGLADLVRNRSWFFPLCEACSDQEDLKAVLAALVAHDWSSNAYRHMYRLEPKRGLGSG